ncbi:MAG: hypothetical protein L0177_06510 [Chloroflexi bacterium]|nr:hypothetical protein [Chloroflexota bacterium]
MADWIEALKRNAGRWRERRAERRARKALERQEMRSKLPGHEFSDEERALDKLRFLRREHMYLDWTSWHSAIRDNWQPSRKPRR